jgi:hypothetical protein
MEKDSEMIRQICLVSKTCNQSLDKLALNSAMTRAVKVATPLAARRRLRTTSFDFL